MVGLLFRCGHVNQVNPDKVASPACLRCGETRIARTVKAPPPRIVGHGRGPLVTAARLEAIPVKLAPAGPLRLKPRTKDEDE